MTTHDNKKKILIIGAGTFGLTTALQLLHRGEIEVKLLDHIRFHLHYPQTAFHGTGIIYAAAGKEDIENIDINYNYLLERKDGVEQLTKPEDFAKLIPLKDDDANQDLFKGCLGAKFVVDSAERLIFSDSEDCLGVRTYSGQIIADKTVICAGANSFRLLDFKNQLLAKCWTVGHIKLTDEDADSLRGIPVVLNLNTGFIFEPDSNNELKFCNEFLGYINMETNNSVPVYRNEIPIEAENQMRNFLKQIFPQFSARPFAVAKICWCTDTPDRHFLICEHPDTKDLC